MAARSLIGLFLAAPTDQLLGSSVVTYARTGYAAVVLLKIRISAALPGGAMNGLLLETAPGDSATLIHQYLESLVGRLEELQAEGGSVAIVWLYIFRAILAWYESYFIPALNGSVEEAAPCVSALHPEIGPVLEPFRHCIIPRGSATALQTVPAFDRLSGGSTPGPGIGQSPSVSDMDIEADRGAAFVSLDGDILGGQGNEDLVSTAQLAWDLEEWIDPDFALGDMQRQFPDFSSLPLT